MARGWESKSVEEQKESVDNKQKGALPAAADAGQLDKKRQQNVLELSRKKVLADIEATTNPRYKATLEAALKDLDKKIELLR